MESKGIKTSEQLLIFERFDQFKLTRIEELEHKYLKFTKEDLLQIIS